MAQLTPGFQILYFVLLRLIYNGFFRHPGIPGPILWRMTDWTFAISAASGDLHHRLLDMHQKYGIISQSGFSDLQVPLSEFNPII
jgi:hypothetical protein